MYCKQFLMPRMFITPCLLVFVPVLHDSPLRHGRGVSVVGHPVDVAAVARVQLLGERGDHLLLLMVEVLVDLQGKIGFCDCHK